MKACGRADHVRVTLQLGAAGELGVFKLLDAREVASDYERVGERPQMLGGLQFGRVGWKDQQVHVLGHTEAHAGMPTGTVEHEDDLLGGTGPDGTGKRGELHCKHGNADGRGQMQDGAPRGRVDKADEGAPGEAVAHQRHWSVANGRPDPPHHRLEPDAVFIDRPQLDAGMWKGRRDRP